MTTSNQPPNPEGSGAAPESPVVDDLGLEEGNGDLLKPIPVSDIGLLKEGGEIRSKEQGLLNTKDIETRKENTRSALALLLLLILSGSIFASFVYIFAARFLPSEGLQCAQLVEEPTSNISAGSVNSTTASRSGTASPQAPAESRKVCISDNGPEQLITLILNSLTTIIGTALGFYFGAQGKEELRAAVQANNTKADPKS